MSVRFKGSCWINHMCKALQRLVDRNAAFLSHVTTLVEDQSIKSTE